MRFCLRPPISGLSDAFTASGDGPHCTPLRMHTLAVTRPVNLTIRLRSSEPAGKIHPELHPGQQDQDLADALCSGVASKSIMGFNKKAQRCNVSGRWTAIVLMLAANRLGLRQGRVLARRMSTDSAKNFIGHVSIAFAEPVAAKPKSEGDEDKEGQEEGKEATDATEQDKPYATPCRSLRARLVERRRARLLHVVWHSLCSQHRLRSCLQDGRRWADLHRGGARAS